jgi:hypothetical protein
MNIEITPKVVCEIDGQECVILKTFILVYPFVDETVTAHIVMYNGKKRLILSEGNMYNMISQDMINGQPNDVYQLLSLKEAYYQILDDINEALAELK